MLERILKTYSINKHKIGAGKFCSRRTKEQSKITNKMNAILTSKA